MRNLEENHFLHYSILILGLGTFFTLLYLFNYNTTFSLIISFGGSLFYVLWGIIHHALEKRLYREVILEYVLIGIFMFLLLALVTIY